MTTKPLTYYRGIRIKADLGLHEQIAAAVTPLLGPGSRVLDFGAGEGALSQRLADLGFDVQSVDIEVASFKASTAFERLDFNDRQAVDRFLVGHRGLYDLVIGVEVIEHVENPWQYVRDLTVLVHPGGLILITTPNVTSWYSRLKFLRTGRLHQFEDADRAYGHINPVGEDELRLIATRCDLTVLSVKPGGWLPRLWLAGGKREILWNVIAFAGTFWMKGMWDGWCLIVLCRRDATVE